MVLAAAFAALTGVSASAMTLTADIELEFFDSGNGPLAGPYGGDTLGSGFPIALADTMNALDGNASTFVSLPTDSFMTVGFSGGFVFDGAGDDIFVTETGAVNELADVFVSSNGIDFFFLGTAGAGGTETFDLADIGFADPVNAIKVVGLDLGGGSPGYDLAIVQGLEGSVVIDPVPLPAGFALMLGGIGGLAALKRRKRKQAA